MKLRDLLRRDDDTDVGGHRTADGGHTAEPVTVVHRVHIPNADAAEALTSILRNYGFETTTVGETVEVRVDVTPGDERARHAHVTIEELAAEHGGTYEGAETVVT